MADSVCGALGDSVSSTLHQVIAKLDVVEGRMAAHDSSNRAFVERSIGQFRDHLNNSATSVNELSDSVATLNSAKGGLDALVGKVGPLVESLKAVVDNLRSLPAHVDDKDKEAPLKWQCIQLCRTLGLSSCCSTSWCTECPILSMKVRMLGKTVYCGFKGARLKRSCFTAALRILLLSRFTLVAIRSLRKEMWLQTRFVLSTDY